VLRGAGLALYPGEVAGLAGENGSGKSTLMKILVGALAPDAGSVRRAGRLGYCPQEPQVYERLTCDEHFELFGHAYGITRAAQVAARRGLYEALGFGQYAGTRADQLSGGTLAKLNLGLALLADPQVLLLDEPRGALLPAAGSHRTAGPPLAAKVSVPTCPGWGAGASKLRPGPGRHLRCAAPRSNMRPLAALNRHAGSVTQAPHKIQLRRRAGCGHLQ